MTEDKFTLFPEIFNPTRQLRGRECVSNRLLEIPPLPKPQRYFGHSDTMPMYGPDEVMEYAAAAVKAEREACAVTCERYGSSYFASKIRERSNAALTGAKGVRVEGTVMQHTGE